MKISNLFNRIVSSVSVVAIFLINLPEYTSSQCCPHCVANFTSNPWKEFTPLATPISLDHQVESPGNPCYKVFETQQTCCSNTRDILEYMLGRSSWSFEESTNVYTLSNFYSIFLKEVNEDIKTYLDTNKD